jgi:hypothetical protein
MRAAIAVFLTLSVAPAEAHCYSHWAYPQPQPGCHAHSLLAHRAAEQSHDWYVEIQQLPPGWTLDPDPEREQGIEKLKKLQEEKAQ